MKIGILTFHYAYNYGAVWQCYGLQKALQRLTNDSVEVINVVPKKWHWFLLGIPHKLSLDAFKKAYIKFIHGDKCVSAFEQFRKEKLNCSPRIKMVELNKLSSMYDVIFVGSDQVWAPSQRKDILYFLDWTPKFTGKRISYAPCCTTKIMDESQRNKLSLALKDFHKISARNLETQDFVENLIGENVPLVPDPTLLTDYSCFIKPYTGKPYILIFVLGPDIIGGNNNAFDILRRLYPNTELVAVVAAKHTPVLIHGVDEVKYNATPEEWLNYIAHARLVYTDSFHATIFSIKFNTPFVAYVSSPLKKSRFDDLSKRFGAGEHIVTNIDALENVAVLPAIDCQNLLDIQKNIGEEYIKNALK